jgi:hypothetical protein
MLVFWLWREPPAGHPAKIPVPTGAPATNLPVPAAGETSRIKSAAGAAGVLPDWAGFQPRPLPVAYESPHFQWTQADGRDTNVIRQLAHNRLEYDRMVEENPRIFRRQLVYLKETPAAVFERAKLTGAPVNQLTVPGVDGQELEFQIVQRDAADSSRHGLLRGHLVGNNDSLVTLAFQDGREAFTVLSPKNNVFVVGEPREDGQVIVKAIDPNTYGMGPQDVSDLPKPNPDPK